MYSSQLQKIIKKNIKNNISFSINNYNNTNNPNQSIANANPSNFDEFYSNLNNNESISKLKNRIPLNKSLEMSRNKSPTYPMKKSYIKNLIDDDELRRNNILNTEENYTNNNTNNNHIINFVQNNRSVDFTRNDINRINQLLYSNTNLNNNESNFDSTVSQNLTNGENTIFSSKV